MQHGGADQNQDNVNSGQQSGVEEVSDVDLEADNGQEHQGHQHAQVHSAAQLSDSGDLTNEQRHGGDQQDADSGGDAGGSEACDGAGNEEDGQSDSQQLGDLNDGPLQFAGDLAVFAFSQLFVRQGVGPNLVEPNALLQDSGQSEQDDQSGHAADIVSSVGSSQSLGGSVQSNADSGQVGAAAGVGADEHAGQLPAFVDHGAEDQAQQEGNDGDADAGGSDSQQGGLGQLQDLTQVNVQQHQADADGGAVGEDGVVDISGGGGDADVGHHDTQQNDGEDDAGVLEELELLQHKADSDGDHDQRQQGDTVHDGEDVGEQGMQHNFSPFLNF